MVHDIPEEWRRLGAAAKRVCDEHLLVHQTHFHDEIHAADCAACALRDALAQVIDMKSKAS